MQAQRTFNKRHVIIVPVLVTLVSCTFLLNATARPDDDGDSKIEQQMERVRDAYRKLRSTAGNPSKKVEALAAIRAMQAAAHAAKVEKPEKYGSIPAAKQEAFLTAFRIEMIQFEKQLLDIEVMLLSGKTKEAKTAVSKLNLMKKAAHRKFKGKD